MIGRRQAMALGAGVVAVTLALRSATSGKERPGGVRWAVDYGAATDPVLARQFEWLVLEPHHPRPIAPLRGEGSRLLGYVSLGEVEKRRPYFTALDRAGALGVANPDWPDARRVDLRHPAWTAMVLDRIVPEILSLGYDGIFIDTMDNAEAMERQDPKGAKDMVAAGASLIAAIRARFPAIRIMLNRGYAMLDRVAPSIDLVLGESMASRWNFATKRYDRLSDSDWQWQADRLRAAKAINPRLLLTTLDYWDMTDSAAVAALYARERAAGFSPYVSTLALDRLWPEPAE